MNKQIEEVIRDICPFFKAYGTCELCNTELDIEDEPCYWECMANDIIKYGYRKESEVAREIIAEIESIHEEGRSMIAWMENFFKKIAKLKQKYGVTEE